MKRNLVKVGAFLLIAAIVFSFLNVLLRPKRRVEVAVDNYHNEYRGIYSLPNHQVDVYYIGSSHSFCSISPEDIFHQYGITGYVQGSSCQKVWQSYYYLEEFLRTQMPRVVILDTFMALDGGAQSEAFNRESIDKMKFSKAKLESAWTACKMNPSEESFIGYIFPALRYHDRWEELSAQDYKYFTTNSNSPAKGFLVRFGSVSTDFNIDAYADKCINAPEMNTTCAQYLEKIKLLCDENSIDFILVKYPTCLWNYENSLSVKNWADKNNIPFLDFNADEALRESVSIDWSTDSLDGGNHLNYDGAMKMSKWMGEYLQDRYAFEDKRESPDYSVWAEDYNYYKKCVKNLSLPGETDFAAYMSRLRDEGYLACMSVNFIDMRGWQGASEVLQTFGISQEFLSHTLNVANLAILENGHVAFEAFDENAVNYNKTIDGFSIRAESRYSESGQSLSCICDKTQRARNELGLQLVVLDPLTKSYIETSNWLVSADGTFSRS